tara:strand:+ start:188 stop:484 length:297 start_codon:yes stop_codon:yes gene_type:complete
MEYLIGILVLVVLYLRVTIWKDDVKEDKDLNDLKAMMDDIEIETPYKIEPIVAVKKKTRKRTVKKVVAKKLPKKVVKKKKIVKPKVKKKVVKKKTKKK